LKRNFGFVEKRKRKLRSVLDDLEEGKWCLIDIEFSPAITYHDVKCHHTILHFFAI